MLEVFEPHATITIKAAQEALEHLHETPVGRVDCGCLGNDYSDPGVCFVTCSDGRVRKLRYTCPRCRRFVPYCYGAADVFSQVCDDCYCQLRALVRHAARMVDVALLTEVGDDLYVPIRNEIWRWVDPEFTFGSSIRELVDRLHMSYG